MSSRLKLDAKTIELICKRYQNGETCSDLAKEYGVHANTIYFWVRMYEANGAKVFEKNDIKGNKKYSKEFKLKLVEEYLSGQSTTREICYKYGMLSHTVVERWIKKYNNGIEFKECNSKRGIYAMKSRKTTLEERIEIVNYVLANDNDYKGAAEKYCVPYANVYQWVMKYNKSGEVGLSDNRGRPSSKRITQELSEVEKKDIEIEKLKRKLEYLELENRVLKKNIEIQKQMERDSRLYDKKINTKQ